MAMEGINYIPIGNSQSALRLNPQANDFQPDAAPNNTTAPRPSRYYGPAITHRSAGESPTTRRNSGSQLDPQASDFQPVPHLTRLAYPLSGELIPSAQPTTYSGAPDTFEASIYGPTHQWPANISLAQIPRPQHLPFGSVNAALIQQANSVPFYQHQPVPPVESQGQAIPPVPVFSTAGNQHDFSGYGQPLPVAGSAPSAPESYQQTFNFSAIDKNIPAQKFFKEMFIAPPQPASGPKTYHDPAEAMSFWGEVSQGQLSVNGQQPSVGASVLHAGKHLSPNLESIPSTPADFPPLQIVEQDGITQPAITGRGRSRRGPANPGEYKKTRTAGACVLCQIKRGSKPFGSCTVDTGKPCPPCVSMFADNADNHCIRIDNQNLRKCLPFDKSVMQSFLPRAPNLSQLKRVHGEDLTVYLTPSTSSNLRSPLVDPILAFKFDGSSNLSERPSHDNLDTFIKKHFAVQLHLDQGQRSRLVPLEDKPLQDLEMCASYLRAISGHAQTEYRTELGTTNIHLAQQISYRILQQYLTRYTDKFKSLFERSIEWMKARKKDGMRRDVAAWLMCGLYELVKFQAAIFVPSSLSELTSRLISPAKNCLEDIRKLAACAAYGMNSKISIPLEEFAASVLPSRHLSAPGVTIAHAFMPRVNSNNTQPPTAIVGLRGNTTPFDKPNSVKVADLHASSGDMGMENLQRLLTPRPTLQTTSTPVTTDHGSPIMYLATQTGEPVPATWSTATERDEVDYRYNPSDLLSNQPYDAFPTHEPTPSFIPFHTPPLPNSGILQPGYYNTPQPTNCAKRSFEDDCATSDEGDDDDLRQASMTSEAKSSWGTRTVITEETGTSFLY
ncbi:MAG: hypothetical protein M1840_000426 [Geoglossum simile]|nr:MAG: hypothetical protein M1840_000426 [Geoglossum simile]